MGNAITGAWKGRLLGGGGPLGTVSAGGRSVAPARVEAPRPMDARLGSKIGASPLPDAVRMIGQGVGAARGLASRFRRGRGPAIAKGR